MAGIGKIFFAVDCYEVKSCWGIEEGGISWDCKDDLWTSKGGIGRWKLTELEEQIFVGDCRGGCIHKEDCENEGAPNILPRIQYTLHWRYRCSWTCCLTTKKKQLLKTQFFHG